MYRTCPRSICEAIAQSLKTRNAETRLPRSFLERGVQPLSSRASYLKQSMLRSMDKDVDNWKHGDER